MAVATPTTLLMDHGAFGPHITGPRSLIITSTRMHCDPRSQFAVWLVRSLVCLLGRISRKRLKLGYNGEPIGNGSWGIVA